MDTDRQKTLSPSSKKCKLRPAMKKKQIAFIALAAVIALAAGYWFSLSTKQGKQAIDFRLPDLQGKQRSLKDWSGKVIVLNFWATWCPPCRDEIPLFIDAQENYKGRGLMIVGIAIDKKQAVASYSDNMLINYPVLLGDEGAMDLMARYGNRIGALPFTVIIDPRGRIVSRKMNAYHSEKELLDAVRPYLKAK